jgi:tetratricopeptide (TPR) repeat protein
VITIREHCLLAVLVLAQTLRLYGQNSLSTTTLDVPQPAIEDTLLRAGIDLELTKQIQADLAAREYARAEDKLLARVQVSARPKGLLETLGGIYFLDSKYLESAIAYKKAESYAALTLKERFTLAMDYVELKRNKWARDELAHLSKDQPGDPLYSYWLGRLDYDDQRFADAKVSFDKALEADKRFVRAYDGIGLCDEALGDTAAAEANYKQANELNRQQGSRLAWPPLNYGSLLRKASRYPEARMLLTEAIAIDPTLSKAYYELGRVEESSSNREGAIENLKKASALDPRDSAPVYALYRVYKESGNAELAASMMARFRALKDQSDKAH